jgi:hypothetical protein
MEINYDKLLIEIKNLHNDCRDYKNKKKFSELSQTEFEEKMINTYPNIKNNFSSIYTQCIDGHMDLSVIIYMINQAKSIQKNKISNHDASVNVGQKLVDKFIKPNIDKNKK